MNILIISQEYPPKPHGGIGTQAFLKAHGLKKLGHSVFVITGGKKRKEYSDEGIDIIEIATPKFDNFLTTMISYSITVALEIKKLNARIKIDIIDFPELWNEGSMHILNQTEYNHIPSVIQLHSPLFIIAKRLHWPQSSSALYKIGINLEELSLKNTNAIYSSSKHTADITKKRYSLKNKIIPTIHTGIDISIFYPENNRDGKNITIVFTGRLTIDKGVVILVKACSILFKKYPHVKLRIIGKEHQIKIVNRLKKIAQKNNAIEMLEFVGQLEGKELRNEYSKADIFAVPSYYEGGPGFAYLEAMACGLPVIGCTGSGLKEVIKSGETGFLIEPRKVDELVNILTKLISNQKLRETIGNNAIHYVKKYMGTGDNVKKIEQFYKEVIDKKI